MARGKVELRRIDDKARRLVSFSKRRSGLLKKARELAVLCDGEVGVIVFSPKGKLSHFPTHSSLEKTIERYKRFLDAERSITDHVLETEGQHEGFATDKTNHEILEVDQRFFGGGNIEQMNVNTLTKLEEELGSALNHIRSRKMAVLMDLVKRLREQEKALVCQNQRLQSVGYSSLPLQDASHLHRPGVRKQKYKDQGDGNRERIAMLTFHPEIYVRETFHALLLPLFCFASRLWASVVFRRKRSRLLTRGPLAAAAGAALAAVRRCCPHLQRTH